jgi:hypothetical protein
MVQSLGRNKAPGSPHDLPLRNVESHVVGAEVRVKLGQVVKWEMGPASVFLQTRHLGEPLGHHVEAVQVSGPFHDARQLVVPDDVEGKRCSGRDIVGQRDANVGLVFLVRG